MNNEPVAWMWEQEINGLARETLFLTYRPWNENAIPLYTHPTKTLTDAIDLLEKYADKLEDERPNKGFSDVIYDCIEALRKAQEK